MILWRGDHHLHLENKQNQNSKIEGFCELHMSQHFLEIQDACLGLYAQLCLHVCFCFFHLPSPFQSIQFLFTESYFHFPSLAVGSLSVIRLLNCHVQVDISNNPLNQRNSLLGYSFTQALIQGYLWKTYHLLGQRVSPTLPPHIWDCFFIFFTKNTGLERWILCQDHTASNVSQLSYFIVFFGKNDHIHLEKTLKENINSLPGKML